jgi:hypothetical protein
MNVYQKEFDNPFPQVIEEVRSLSGFMRQQLGDVIPVEHRCSIVQFMRHIAEMTFYNRGGKVQVIVNNGSVTWSIDNNCYFRIERSLHNKWMVELGNKNLNEEDMQNSGWKNLSDMRHKNSRILCGND